MPLFIILVVTRLSLASRKSRGRIQLLEKDESYHKRLVHIVGQLERQVEDVVADMVDNPGNVRPSSASTLASPADRSKSSEAKGDDTEAALTQAPPAIALTPLQHKLVNWLNSIPQLKKELVWIDPARNSHAIIIARDLKRFSWHAVGEGVLRHWADHILI